MADEFDEVGDADAERDVASKHAGDLKALLKKRPADEEDEVVAEDPPEPDDEEAEETASRQEKRSKRGTDRMTARERAAAAEARDQLLQEQLEQARSRPVEQARPQGNPVAHIDERIKDANKRLAAVHDEWNRSAGKLSKAREEELQAQAEALDVEKMTLVVERRDALLAPQRQREQAAANLRQKAPDVYADPRALAYAQGEFMKRTARGEPDSMETFEAVMQEAREVVLGKRPKPDAAQRGRATGMGAGARAVGATEGPVRISMPAGSALDKMARAAFPKDDPAVARQKWVNANGKAYLSSRNR